MESFDISEFLRRMKSGGVEYSASPEALFAASLDHMRYSFLPQVVLFAKKPEDVGAVLKAADEFEIPVTVRGSGTGCAGGCVPVFGGAVLDVSGVKFINIDAVSRVAHVGAGAITAAVDAEAGKYGLFYAPDPSSHKYSSIGGNIACNAGGLRALKYLTTRENVLALSAYVAGGERIDCGLPLRKFAAGPNLRDFFIGSEGTLGVVAEAWLRLLPVPKVKLAALAFFKDDDSALDGVAKIMTAGLSPAALEFMDAETASCIRARNPHFGMPAECAAVLAEFDGEEAVSQASKFVETLSPFAEARPAKDAAESDAFWKVRRAASQAMYELGDSKLSEDIVLPFAAVGEYFKFFKKLGAQNGLATPVFGHAGDGNYHLHFMYSSADKNARSRAIDAMDAAILRAVEVGGAVSGEHGIGFLKSKYMAVQHRSRELEIMRAVKRVFDPKNILNRGKVYEPFDIKKIEPLKGVKLPWD